MIWKQFLYNFLVLLNGPVQNALFCLMDRYRNVCVWFMARNCRFPKVGNSRLPTWEPQVTIARNCRFPQVRSHGSQPGNQRLPLQATAGSQRLQLMLPNLGTIGYHCKELPIPKGWNWWGSQRGNQRLPWQGTAGSHRLEVMVPNLGTRGYHCKQLPVPRGCNSCFPTWEPDGSQRGNQRLPWQGTAGSQTLKLTVPNLGTRGYHCKELPVPRS